MNIQGSLETESENEDLERSAGMGQPVWHSLGRGEEGRHWMNVQHVCI